MLAGVSLDYYTRLERGKIHRTGTKTYRHPEVGPLELHYDVFEMPGEPGLSIGTYTAEAGTAAADGLALLASWAATQEFAFSQRLDRGDASERNTGGGVGSGPRCS